MEQPMMKHDTGRVAFGGVLAALCVVCLFLTNLVPVASYALPALAGVVIMVAVVELGRRWALAVYAVSSLLSLLLVSDLEAKLVFVLFFGYYAVLKSVFESLHRPNFCRAAKFAVFNAAVIAAYFLAVQVFGLPMDEFQLFGINLPLVFLVLANVVFVVFDIAMTRLATVYILRYREQIAKTFRFTK